MLLMMTTESSGISLGLSAIQEQNNQEQTISIDNKIQTMLAPIMPKRLRMCVGIARLLR
jgi:hypothetical protein